MKVNKKDGQILQHIVRYCDEVNSTIKRFGKSERFFKKDFVYLNAVSMPILQIGELAKRLSDEFIKESVDIPWKNIKGMRDIFAHQYKTMDKDIIWKVAIKGIPELNQKCKNILRENNLEIPSNRYINLDNER